MANSEETKPFRLLDLAQELQDNIYEHILGDIAVVTPKSTTHPLLVAVGGKHHQKAYNSAKEAFFKHSIFKIRVEHIRPFLAQNKKYLPLASNIHIIPNALDSPHVLCIPQALPTPPNPPSMEFVLNMMHNHQIVHSVRTATSPEQMAWFTDLEREMGEVGVRKGVLNMAVVIVKAGEGKEVVRTMWTAEVVENVTRYLGMAGYSRKLCEAVLP